MSTKVDIISIELECQPFMHTSAMENIGWASMGIGSIAVYMCTWREGVCLQYWLSEIPSVRTICCS